MNTTKVYVAAVLIGMELPESYTTADAEREINYMMDRAVEETRAGTVWSFLPTPQGWASPVPREVPADWTWDDFVRLANPSHQNS